MLDHHPRHLPRLGRHRRYSPERPWERFSDTERAVLAPFVFRAADADLSELVFRKRKLRAAMLRAREHGLGVLPDGFLHDYRRLLGITAGRRSIPRCLAPP